MSGLVLESFWANKAACDDAERAYYEKLSGCKPQTQQEEEVDLFASDEEPAEAPVRVKPAPKSTNAKKDAKQAENKAKPNPAPAPASKTPEAAAEDKFRAELAKNPGQLRNPAYMERTFIMLKPDAVQRGLMGEIIERFETRGFKLVAMKFMLASQDLLKTHYSDLSKKPFFPELIRYMSSGPVVPMVFEGLKAVKQGRTMLGATNPKDSAPGTIRGDLCVDVGRNIIHGSDSVESANKEIQLWFTAGEISSWRPTTVEWLYEEEELESKPQPGPGPVSSLTEQIAAARKHIKNSLDSVDNLSSGLSAADEMALMKKLGALEVENKELKKVTDDLKSLVLSLQARVDKLDGGKADAPAAKAAPAPAEEDDDDVDLFGSDDEEDDEEKKRITEERLKAYHEKKAKKPKVIAKTSVLFDVKPWDDETDMDAMLKECKSIEMEGLVWGASKLVPVGYGINKLQVMCVVEDEKVSIDELSEKICEFEDYVQSVDIAAMSKI